MLMIDQFFRNRLDQLIDLRHPLAVLADHRMNRYHLKGSEGDNLHAVLWDAV